MHSFYSKQTSTKVYGIHKSASDQLLEQSFENCVMYVTLNVNVLSARFKDFINKLYDEVQHSGDAALLENMLNSFKFIRPVSFPSLGTNSASTTTESTHSLGVTQNK